MKKVYFITRTLPENNNGGAIVRRGTIRYLKENGYQVIIVAPYKETIISKERYLIKGLSRWSYLYNTFLFQLNIRFDYLENWANNAFDLLKDVVKKEDIVLATSGGEMGSLLLGSKLKVLGCQVVLNLHDPVSYTLLEGKFSFNPKFPKKPRDKYEKKIFESVDKIITSSQSYCDWLKNKYPSMQDKFSCHHFGYINRIEYPQFSLLNNENINVVYGGAMGKLQGPEILLKVAEIFPHVQFTYVGDVNFEIPSNLANVVVKSKMDYLSFMDYLKKNADIGFFSLKGYIAKWCVPSKLYEYINVGLPILAAIEGDAKEIVNKNEFGIATSYDVNSISDALKKLLKGEYLRKTKNNVIEHRHEWFMGNTIKELIEVL